MNATLLGAGVSLKPEHFADADAAQAHGLWFEVHAENYMVAGGPRIGWLQRIRANHPVSVHGVGLSLGGVEPLDEAHLTRLVTLVERIEPALVSEHLAWSVQGPHYLPDLLPFPRTDEALQRLAQRIDRVQTALKRRIALENPSHYLRLDGHAWDEIEFLNALCQRTGCGLLLDINNVFVSANNLDFDPHAYLARFSAEHVMEIHLAGHSRDPALHEALLIDSHDAAVAPEVWSLYDTFIARSGARPTLIERDAQLPSFDELMRERALAAKALA